MRAILMQNCICPDCGVVLEWLRFEDGNYQLKHYFTVGTCPNKGKTFKAPTIELEEIQSNAG